MSSAVAWGKTPRMSSRARFNALIEQVTERIGDAALDQALQDVLNAELGADSELFADLTAACRAGVEEGWLCEREHGGIKFGRVIDAGKEAGRFSVDVVAMNDVKGPYHRHPHGEIDAIMPLDDSAEFDGRPAGWLVYGPESAHYPTVTKGKALVLYLLPEGAIDFKAKPPG